ncbi:hypothetical protein B0H67DRAFT_478951 [Lasiosphaeris hirsuta]|uniref:Probable endonuclease LCL3 n=1 Tax=Lasiosphaeris hirsuta TaxID=260670 RepID=A0AA40BAR4_9PEZI|nr:hypothetical protein B0H67DRAFT_478951 [Lasiosphaeris hirsuta]
MGWGLWSSPPSDDGKGDAVPNKQPRRPSPPPLEVPLKPVLIPVSPPKHKGNILWNETLNAHNWEHYKEPRNYIPPALLFGFSFAFWAFWRSYLRRFPGANHIAPGLFRRRGLLGKVTSVGDGDGFHLFHTPGGRLAGWGWLRRVPKERKDLKGRTISIRLAGVDAPEAAHFGKPAQPFSAEALTFLRSYILGKRVRAFIYKRDQYERVVATVFVRKPPFFFRKDVGLELLKRGLATTYEAKTGAEFGGVLMEDKYKSVEAWAREKGRGMWAQEKPAGLFGFGKKQEIETPRQYKDRLRQLDQGVKK